MSNDNWGPWIGWNGGECPVDRDAVVQVSFKGRGFREGVSNSWLCAVWEWRPGFDHIIAYRVKKEPAVEVVIKDICCDMQNAKCTYTYGKTDQDPLGVRRMNDIKIELETVAVMTGKDDFINGEALAILDEVLGKMTGDNIKHWARNTKYPFIIDQINEAVK